MKASYVKSGLTYLTCKLEPEMVEFFKGRVDL